MLNVIAESDGRQLNLIGTLRNWLVNSRLTLDPGASTVRVAVSVAGLETAGVPAVDVSTSDEAMALPRRPITPMFPRVAFHGQNAVCIPATPYSSPFKIIETSQPRHTKSSSVSP